MTDDEALSKDDTLQALKRDVKALTTFTLTQDDQKGHIQETWLVRKVDVLQLLVKYFRS